MNMAGKTKFSERIASSAVWAAYGDALGFISELANEATLKRRTGKLSVDRLQPWTRRLGGRFGTDIPLPAGCYSDDTQLRLATSRSIRNDGTFDVEAFSKVELPTWRGYALGAGRGSKSAAESLAKSGTQWFSNFYRSATTAYFESGGNGAAMRIQPHVWANASSQDSRSLLNDVVRNTVCTHGHPRAIVGASFHALCLQMTLRDGRIPQFEAIKRAVRSLSILIEIFNDDRDLKSYWLPEWERGSRGPLKVAILEALTEVIGLLQKAERHYSSGLRPDDIRVRYTAAAKDLDAFNPKFVGSATITSVLGYFLALLCEGRPLEAALISANTLGTDTDSIATMAAALVGCHAQDSIPEPVADEPYIHSEAIRLSHVMTDQIGGFDYPDLLYWRPPQTQSDIVGVADGRWVVLGLGVAEPIDGPIADDGKNSGIWQWFKLSFGQAVLTKRRTKVAEVGDELLPFKRNAVREPTLFHAETTETVAKTVVPPKPNRRFTIDEATNECIRNHFAPTIVGESLINLSLQDDGIEKAIAFAAIVAKAKRARQRR